MRVRSVVIAATTTAATALLGNLFVGKAALDWFRGLQTPRWQLPLSGFLAVGAGYYVIMGTILARGVDRRDATTIGWAIAVLAGNEGWNFLLFGRRSPRAAFYGVLIFLVPLAALQRSVWTDKRSRLTLLPYSAFVSLYDVAWSYRLWHLNPPHESL